MESILDTVKGKASFRTSGVFMDCHAPLLVFQQNTLKHIANRYQLTRADFITLTAGWMIQKENPLGYFDNPKVTRQIYGISRNVVFKSLNRLRRRGMIEVDKRQKNHRRFRLTERGEQCIRAYTQLHNLTIWLWEHN